MDRVPSHHFAGAPPAVIRTAVITAAGLGTRLRPATAVIPKVMLPLVDTPTIQLVVGEALGAGVERVVIVIGHGGNLIRRHFAEVEGPWRGRITWIEQPSALGLGDAILCARGAVGEEPFAVLFGDCVFLGDNPTLSLARDFDAHGQSLLGVQRVASAEVSRRGIIELAPAAGDRLLVRRVVEKPAPGEAPSDLASVGRDLFTPEIFDALAAVSPDDSGEIQLAPAINALIAREPVAAWLISEPRLDIGDPAGYIGAFRAAAERRAELLQERKP
jgi:UTP--glucose-1-phosphate uridylyltransferase